MEAGHDLWALLLISSVIALLSIKAIAKPQFTAMYVFGDSLHDPGNNIYFRDSIAKANFWPYGLDWERGPNGRFCNGELFVDFLAKLLGLPILPSYASTIANGTDILSGVNYASAGAGILQDSGKHFGRIIPLSDQIGNFKNTSSQLSKQMQKKQMSNYLAKALAFMSMGANDYLNNYFYPERYITSHIYTPTEFVDLLMKLYYGYLSELHSLGLRKFLISEIAPLGCIPFRVAKTDPPPGECESYANNMVQMFNLRLKLLVRRLNKDFPRSVFTVGAAFEIFIHVRENADAYGFKMKDTACCGLGEKRGSKVLCPPNGVPCYNRNEYIFWDSAHPTQTANRILAQLAYNNTSYSSPFSMRQLANM